jgi:hypothetical protein
MTLKIVGSSHNKEFVQCNRCLKKYVWLIADEISPGKYISICYECKKELKKEGLDYLKLIR